MSNTVELNPSLDFEALKKATQEAAMKGAIKSIEEYYTSYASPFQKAITEQLNKQEIGGIIELPDIIALINQSLSKEIDKIANTAVAKSFIPMVTRVLTRESKEVQFSQILKEVVEQHQYDNPDPDDFSVEIKEHPEYGWLDVTIEAPNASYRMTMHSDNDSKKQGLKKYKILSLPYGAYDDRTKKMTLTIENASLDLPFTPDVLRDKVTAKIARLVLSESLISIDTDYFEHDLFPQPCHCH